MFDRLKNLFRRLAEDDSATEPAPSTFPPREFQPGYSPADPASAPPQPAPAPHAAPSRPSDADALETAQPATGDSIKILLKPVLLKLPDALKARVRQPPAGPIQISIPLQKVLAQLPQGSVRMSFGELRQASPAGVFVDSSEQDQTPVELSLPEILTQIRPEQLPRRAAQKKVAVPDEVGGIFGPKGQPISALRMGGAPARAPAPPAPPEPAISPRLAPASAPVSAPKPAARHAPAQQPVQPITPSSPLTSSPIKPSTPLPAPSALRMQPAPTPALHPAAAAPAPVAAPAAPSSAAPMEPLVVPLAQLSGAWPEAIKLALADLADAKVTLPPEELEQGMKRGKILFTWKRIRALIDPPLSPSEPQALDETELELPLPVVAPLFMAHKRPIAPQKKYTLGEQIPDLFTGKGMVASPHAQVAAPAAAPSAPAAPTIPRPAPVAPARPAVPATAAPALAAAPPPPQEIGEVFGQPGRKNWTPSEIVQKTGALRGVAGALIAMQDGLLVAGNLPPGLNGETIAAFMPQMFSRMMQYSKELKFGEANKLTLIVDNVPLKIFKVGGVFFTVLGRAEETLPEPHLSIVAAQLGPQSK